jgi:hypothetical protein
MMLKAVSGFANGLCGGDRRFKTNLTPQNAAACLPMPLLSRLLGTGQSLI